MIGCTTSTQVPGVCHTLGNAKQFWLIIANQAESDSCVSCVPWDHWGVLGHNEDEATGELVSLDSALHPNVA